MEESCVWKLDDVGWDDTFWETSCEEVAILLGGSPNDNNFKYCPFCGRQIREELKDD